MRKIVMIPLDERPCNYKYPTLLPRDNYEIILPGKDIMPKKRQEANHDGLVEWLLNNVKDADAVILSMDTLIFGGLVPSRLHHYSFDTFVERLDVIKKIKEINPKVLLFGFELIMRCPGYNSADEEPFYYEWLGKDIHRLGELTHLESLNMLSEEERQELRELKASIDPKYINDYLTRRDINLNVLLRTLEYVKEGLFDYFIVPQDDASVYGFTACDQIKVRKFIKDNSLHAKVSMYPAADDVGLSLVARSVSSLNGYKPRVFVKYSSTKAPFCIPWFEDRMQDETIKYHILSIGGVRVYSLTEADIVLCVNMTSKMLDKTDSEYVSVYDIERNLSEFVSFIKYAKEMKKIVAIADTAFCNGSDPELVRLLNEEGLLMKVDSYAGWNTSSNTMGTTLACACIYHFGFDGIRRKKFLVYRYFEDYAYMVYVRKDVTDNVLPQYGCDYFELKNTGKVVSETVKQKIDQVIKKDLPCLMQYVKDFHVKMPWNRMFEIELSIDFEEDKL